MTPKIYMWNSNQKGSMEISSKSFDLLTQHHNQPEVVRHQIRESRWAVLIRLCPHIGLPQPQIWGRCLESPPLSNEHECWLQLGGGGAQVDPDDIKLVESLRKLCIPMFLTSSPNSAIILSLCFQRIISKYLENLLYWLLPGKSAEFFVPEMLNTDKYIASDRTGQTIGLFGFV